MEMQDIYRSEGEIIGTIIEYMDLRGEEIVSKDWLANVDIRKVRKEINKIKKEGAKYVIRGGVKVKLTGKPFVIGVDTFDSDDWFDGYFDTDEEALEYAEKSGGTMLKKHAYNKDGKHIGAGGTF